MTKSKWINKNKQPIIVTNSLSCITANIIYLLRIDCFALLGHHKNV